MYIYPTVVYLSYDLLHTFTDMNIYFSVRGTSVRKAPHCGDLITAKENKMYTKHVSIHY